MPDDWERITRREVTPSPVRSPSRLPVFAVVAASLALVVAVVAGLLPLARQADVPSGADEPPGWLVDAAYRAAYGNGDMLPDGAEWALLPRSAIPTPVGPAGAGSDERDYVVVLHGSFTGYGLSSPTRASIATGSVLAIAYDASTHDVTDLALTDGDPGIEGLQAFDLPPASAVFTSSAGWTAAVPPGWAGGVGVTNWGGSGTTVSYVSNTESFTLAGGDTDVPPQASSEGFPRDGVAIVVAPAVGPIPQQVGPLPEPPLSAAALSRGSAPNGGSTLDSMFFQGRNGIYVLTVRAGADASQQDTDAANDVIASIAWPSGSNDGLP
jgi:hypothetical protein